MRPPDRFPIAALALFAALAVATGAAADRVLAGMGAGRPYEVTWVPRGEALRLASAGIRLSFADYYWLSTVQYVGDPQAQRRGLEKLYPLVDFVTDLDPAHGYAYQTAGIVLSSEGRLDESERILRKGMEKGPNWWSYPMYVAFNHFFYRGDYETAARWAEIAARTPGASPNVSHLALALDVKSGAPDHAIRFLEEMLGAAKDDTTRSALEEQRRLALLQRDYKILDDAVARFRAVHGRPPAAVGELVSAGVLPSVPRRDPYGGVYEIRGGEVHATGGGHRFAPPERGRLGSPPPPIAPPPATTRP
jgi:tetratricopeptide (TPR) repeat protein